MAGISFLAFSIVTQSVQSATSPIAPFSQRLASLFRPAGGIAAQRSKALAAMPPTRAFSPLQSMTLPPRHASLYNPKEALSGLPN